MKKNLLLIFLILTCCFCNEKKESIAENPVIRDKDTTLVTNKKNPINNYQSGIQLDTSLLPEKIDLTLLHSDNDTDTLIAFCNCEKNVKKNTLIVQVRNEFPPESELLKGNRQSTLFIENIPVQYRSLTFYLKDSIVMDVKLLKVSSESQFDGERIDSLTVQKYRIKINKFDYKIAQDVWGSYEVLLPNGYGYFENDTLIRGTFICNNWKAVSYEDLENWTSPAQY